MKTIQKAKYVALGVIIALIISALAGTAFAAIRTAQATLEYSVNAITLDGKTIEPKDANGNKVEPFTIDGTTYLPVRAISGALGLGVDWDSATGTVKLTSNAASPTPAPPTPAPPASTPSGTVLYNKNNIVIKYMGLVQNNSSYSKGYDLKLHIENNSDIGYMFQVENMYINGYKVYGIFSPRVAAGQSSNDSITIFQSYLDENSITKINDVELTLNIINNDDWSKTFKSDIFTIKP